MFPPVEMLEMRIQGLGSRHQWYRRLFRWVLGIRGNDTVTDGAEAYGAFGQRTFRPPERRCLYGNYSNDEHRDCPADGQGTDDICGCGDATRNDAPCGREANHQPAVYSHHASPEVIWRGCLEQCVRGDEEEDHAEADTDDEPASDSHAAAVC